MSLPEERPPQVPTASAANRILPWLTVILLLVFAGLGIHQFLSRNRETINLQLSREAGESILEGWDRSLPVGPWPQWRGPYRDGVSRETGLLDSWPDVGPPRLWESTTGPGYSSFAVAHGRVFTMIRDGNHEAVLCWDADDGREIWRFRYPCPVNFEYGPGPRSTPTIDGNVVFTVGATGIMHCLNAKSNDPKGEMIWSKDLLKDFQAPNLRWGISFSPLVEGDRVFVNPGGPNGNSLAALDRKTGAVLWKSQDDPAGYSSPMGVTVSGQRQIIFFTGTALVAVTPDEGKVLWRYDWSTSYNCNIATPIIRQDYSLDSPRLAAGVGLPSGPLGPIPNLGAWLAYNPGKTYVYISSGYNKGCGLLKLSRQANGAFLAERVYENNRMCNHFSSSVYYKNHVYGFNESTLVCMEFHTGKVKWKQRDFDKGTLLIADGHLILLGESGLLALAEANSEEYREISRFQLFEQKCWSAPALANGKLFVRNEERIVCLNLKKS